MTASTTALEAPHRTLLGGAVHLQKVATIRLLWAFFSSHPSLLLNSCKKSEVSCHLLFVLSLDIVLSIAFYFVLNPFFN
jgi:hypothetical protein